MKPLLAAVAATVALSGCVSVLPEPTIPSALIQLPASRAQAPSTQLRADVNVFPPDASRAYNGVDIAVHDGLELVYLADVRWADTAPRLLQNAVINALAKAGGQGMANPAQLGARADYDLRWRVIDISVSKETGPVHIEVAASLVDSATRRTIAQKGFAATGTPSGSEPRARAAALAVAMQQVSDQVAAFAAETAAPRAAAAAPPT
jgi:cholesterol transport system auxiliary component